MSEGEWHYEPEIETDEHGNFRHLTGISICAGPHPTDQRLTNRGQFGVSPVEVLLPYVLLQVCRRELVWVLEAILGQKQRAQFERETVTDQDCRIAVCFGIGAAYENARVRWEHRNERK